MSNMVFYFPSPSPGKSYIKEYAYLRKLYLQIHSYQYPKGEQHVYQIYFVCLLIMSATFFLALMHPVEYEYACVREY